MTKNCLRPPSLAAALLLAATSASCGDTAGVAHSTSVAGSRSPRAGAHGATAHTKSNPLLYDGYLHEDGERDNDDPGTPHYEQDEHTRFLARYGRPPRPAEARAIATLVKHYFAASVAGDDASACALLSAAASTALAVQHGSRSGASACAATIPPLLAQAHQHLLAENPATMVVIGIYTKGDFGLALLGFKHSPESSILIEREAGTWKIGSIFDNHMT
jgi:hypothetical protein